MNAVNFCYWLQGARELSGLDEPSDEQVAIIRTHLDLVPVATSSGNRLFDFIEGLRASWMFGSPSWPKVWDALDCVFDHVIDKMAAGDQKVLNHIHGPNPDGLMIRC